MDFGEGLKPFGFIRNFSKLTIKKTNFSKQNNKNNK
jgi:hypothetical protein